MRWQENFSKHFERIPQVSVYLLKRIDNVEHPDASNDMKLRFEFLKQTWVKLLLVANVMGNFKECLQCFSIQLWRKREEKNDEAGNKSICCLKFAF